MSVPVTPHDHWSTENVLLRINVTSLKNSAEDQIAEKIPESKTTVEKIGNDSTMESMKSEELASVTEKSEKSNDVNAKNPERVASAARSMAPNTMRPSDAKSTVPKATVFRISIRRSRFSMLSRILVLRSAAGAGA